MLFIFLNRILQSFFDVFKSINVKLCIQVALVFLTVTLCFYFYQTGSFPHYSSSIVIIEFLISVVTVAILFCLLPILFIYYISFTIYASRFDNVWKNELHPIAGDIKQWFCFFGLPLFILFFSKYMKIVEGNDVSVFFLRELVVNYGAVILHIAEFLYGIFVAIFLLSIFLPQRFLSFILGLYKNEASEGLSISKQIINVVIKYVFLAFFAEQQSVYSKFYAKIRKKGVIKFDHNEFFVISFLFSLLSFVGILLLSVIIRNQSSECFSYLYWIYFATISISVFVAFSADNKAEFYFSNSILFVLFLGIFLVFGIFTSAINDMLAKINEGGGEKKILILNKQGIALFGDLHIPLYQKNSNAVGITYPVKVNAIDDDGVHFQYPAHSFFSQKMILGKTMYTSFVDVAYPVVFMHQDFLQDNVYNIQKMSSVTDLVFGWNDGGRRSQFYIFSGDKNNTISIGTLLHFFVSSYKLNKFEHSYQHVNETCLVTVNDFCYDKIWNTPFERKKGLVTGVLTEPTLSVMIADQNRFSHHYFTLKQAAKDGKIVDTIVSTPEKLLAWYGDIFNSLILKETIEAMVGEHHFPGLMLQKYPFGPLNMNLYIAQSYQNQRAIYLIHIEPFNLNLLLTYKAAQFTDFPFKAILYVLFHSESFDGSQGIPVAHYLKSHE